MQYPALGEERLYIATYRTLTCFVCIYMYIMSKDILMLSVKVKYTPNDILSYTS